MAKKDTSPADVSAERRILGMLMFYQGPPLARAVHELCSVTEAEDFFLDRHKRLLLVILRRVDQGHPCDMVSVCSDDEVAQQADDFGGMGYVASLCDDVPPLESLAYFAKRVKDRASRRRFLDRARSAIAMCHEGDPLPECYARIEPEHERATGEPDTLATVVTSAWEAIVSTVEAREAGTQVGLSMPWPCLAEWLTISATDLVVVGGRPGMGKTAFVMQYAAHVAETGGVVAIFELEMPKHQLAYRIGGQRAGVPPVKLIKGTASRDDLVRVRDEFDDMTSWSMIVDDTPGQTIHEIRRKARRIHRRYGRIDMIVVDHIALCSGVNQAQENNKNALVGYVSRICKELAKELSTTVFAISQLNRGVENRTSKRPGLADLRESGEVEQDADIVMFLYRDEYYHGDMSSKHGIGEVIVAKNRNGETKDHDLRFTASLMRFESMDPHRYGGVGW